MTGVRWAESSRRGKRRVVEACFKDSRKHYINPIIDWTNEDVWKYIKENRIKYCSLYDEGFNRLGCIGCPMAGREGRLKEFARWPRFEKKYRDAFEIAAKLRLENPSRNELIGNKFLKWDDGKSMFNWWMEEKHQKQDPDQTVMFE